MRQLKFLITLVLLATAFIFLQNKFNFLNISVTENKHENQEQEKTTIVNESNSYVEIFTGEGQSVRVNVELAKTDQERALGLSNRKYLGTYDGMWFVFNQDVTNSFWMKDCLIPLDIIFIDSSGFIVDIKDNNEPCSDNYCPSIHSSVPYRNVLEVNANFASSNGVEVGQSITTYFDTDIN